MSGGGPSRFNNDLLSFAGVPWEDRTRVGEDGAFGDVTDVRSIAV
jgi:hypothetical protein